MPWAKSNPPSPYYMQVLASLAAEYGFDLETAWQDLPGEVKLIILYGTGGKAIPLTFKDGRLLWPEVVHVIEDGAVEFRGQIIKV